MRTAEGMRTKKEIQDFEENLFDQLWYERSVNSEEYFGPQSEESRQIALDAQARLREKRADFKLPDNAYELGVLEGKLSALRWVLGDDWDNLDT